MPRHFSNAENNRALFANKARIEKLRYELIENYGKKKFSKKNYSKIDKKRK